MGRRGSCGTDLLAATFFCVQKWGRVSLGAAGLPVFAVLDALTQRGSLVERRVSTAAGTGGQDAVLERGETKRGALNKDRRAASGWRRAPALTVEGVALFLRSAETAGLAGTFVVELPDEPFLPESSAAVLLSACPPLLE